VAGVTETFTQAFNRVFAVVEGAMLAAILRRIDELQRR